ncbi:MAG: hypothetical protein JWO68_388 [Actinomycetia bacterium]|nr:hypothetical protein [Actinomycetes bacterium]
MTPHMHAVASSDLWMVGYDDRSAELWIRFRNYSHLVYVYANVPVATYQQLLASGSKGRYFHARIKDRYRFRRLAWRNAA